MATPRVYVCVTYQKTIADSNGVAAIAERLSAEAGDDVAEMLTAILWNLSSCSVVHTYYILSIAATSRGD